MGSVIREVVKIVEIEEGSKVWSKRLVGWFLWIFKLFKIIMVRKKIFELGLRFLVYGGLL